jgi:hypothetical protein
MATPSRRHARSASSRRAFLGTGAGLAGALGAAACSTTGAPGDTTKGIGRIAKTYFSSRDQLVTLGQAIRERGAHVSIANLIEMQMRHGMPPFQQALDHGILPSLSPDVGAVARPCARAHPEPGQGGEAAAGQQQLQGSVPAQLHGQLLLQRAERRGAGVRAETVVPVRLKPDTTYVCVRGTWRPA